MKEFNERLKELRKASGLTQSDLAEKLNVHLQTVSKWERGMFQPDLSQLGDIAAALSVSLEKLLGEPEGDKSYTGVFNVEKFGKCIAELRSASGLSQQQLGELLEVSPDIVSRWERGVTCPDIDKFVVISRQFNVSVSQLYCAITPQQKHDTVQRVRTNSVVARSLLLLAVCVVALFLAVGLFLIPTTTKPVYTLTFDGVQYNYADGELVSPVAEKKEGYTFVGWVDSNGERVQFPIKVQFEETYTSQYVLNEYTVDYWLNGGYFISSPETIVTIESPTLDLPIPTKDGMEFLGWYTSPDYSGEAVTEVHFCESNIKVYAKWSEVVYTIKYNLNGGILYGATNPSTVTAYETVKLVNPLRNGYTFLGWFDAPYGGNLYTSIGGQGFANVVLYAQWQVNTSVYNISYELNGGELLQDNPLTVVSGDYVKLNEATKLGHDFVGWCDSADGNGKFYQYLSSIEDDLKLFAIFTPKQYTIRYEYKGSYLGSEYNPNTIEYGQTVTLLPVGMYGYTFLGWYTAENGGIKIEVIDESNIGTFTVLYARYSVIKYNISYELNGGELTQENPSTVAVDDYVKLNEPTKLGHDFWGWCDSADGNGKFYQYLSGVEDDLKLFAIFTPKQYTIRYEYKGSYLGGEYNPNTIEYGQTVTLLPVGMHGYTFLGWYTAENGGSKIEVIDESNIGTFTVLYARYSIIKYNIDYELNGGELTQDNPTQVTSGDYYNLNNPTKHGHDFVGWCDSADGNGKFYQYLSGVEDDLKLFAIFTPKQYTIRYEYKGSYLGSEYNPNTIEYGQTVELLPVGMHGYTFLGWYTAENGGSKVDVIDESNVESITVLHARYSVNTYQIHLDGNGGNVETSAGLQPNYTLTVTFGERVTLPNAQRENFSFLGWFNDDGKQVVIIDTLNISNMTLTAMWQDNTVEYTIEYVLDGGTLETLNPTTGSSGTSVALNSPVKNGYLFLGWYDNPYATGSPYTYIPSGRTEDIVLYAIWQEIKVSGSAQYFNYEKGIDTVVITEYTGESGEDVVVNIPAFIEDLPVVELQCRFAGTYRAINIPEGIVSIGDSCFYGVAVREDLVIPSSVCYIGSSAFHYATLPSIQFEECNIEIISESAFSFARVTNPIRLPNSVVSLESKAFYYVECPGIILPEGLKIINEYALWTPIYDFGWRDLYLPSTIEYIATNGVSVWYGGTVYAGFSKEKTESFANDWGGSNERVYDVKPNTVTFVDGDNTWTEYGTALALAEPTKNGYKFDGWMDENGNIYSKVFVASQPTTLTAVYRKSGEGDGLAEKTARQISLSVTATNYCVVGDKFYFTIDCQQASYVSLQVVCENADEYQLSVKNEDGQYSQLTTGAFLYSPNQVLMLDITDVFYFDVSKIEITVNLV